MLKEVLVMRDICSHSLLQFLLTCKPYFNFYVVKYGCKSALKLKETVLHLDV